MPQPRSVRAEPLFDGCPFMFLVALTAMAFLCMHLQYSWMQRSAEIHAEILKNHNSLKEAIPLLKQGLASVWSVFVWVLTTRSFPLRTFAMR